MSVRRLEETEPIAAQGKPAAVGEHPERLGIVSDSALR